MDAAQALKEAHEAVCGQLSTGGCEDDLQWHRFINRAVRAAYIQAQKDGYPEHVQPAWLPKEENK